MNQEYLRRTVKKLLWLSDYLASEFDVTSDNYSEIHIRFQERKIRDIYDLADKAKSQKDIGMLMSEAYVDPWLYRQLNMADLIKTDPFLPKEIRKKVAETYSDRAEKMGTAYCKVIEKYCKDLYDGRLKDGYEEIDRKVRGKIGQEYRKVKWGWEDAQKKINKLRQEIEEYLISLK
jgi:hypothetical protein